MKTPRDCLTEEQRQFWQSQWKNLLKEEHLLKCRLTEIERWKEDIEKNLSGEESTLQLESEKPQR